MVALFVVPFSGKNREEKAFFMFQCAYDWDQFSVIVSLRYTINIVISYRSNGKSYHQHLLVWWKNFGHMKTQSKIFRRSLPFPILESNAPFFYSKLTLHHQVDILDFVTPLNTTRAQKRMNCAKLFLGKDERQLFITFKQSYILLYEMRHIFNVRNDERLHFQEYANGLICPGICDLIGGCKQLVGTNKIKHE